VAIIITALLQRSVKSGIMVSLLSSMLCIRVAAFLTLGACAGVPVHAAADGRRAAVLRVSAAPVPRQRWRAILPPVPAPSALTPASYCLPLLSAQGRPQQMAYPVQLQQQPMQTPAPAYQQVLPRAAVQMTAPRTAQLSVAPLGGNVGNVKTERAEARRRRSRSSRVRLPACMHAAGFACPRARFSSC
jgi:hypothetical protein